jgi:hypothetical protein
MKNTADYIDENGNEVYEISSGVDVFRSPDGRWHKSTLTDETDIESFEAQELIASR